MGRYNSLFEIDEHLFIKRVFIKHLKRLSALLKKSLWPRCFPVDFAKFLGTTFFTEQLRWLLLWLQARTTEHAMLREFNPF